MEAQKYPTQICLSKNGVKYEYVYDGLISEGSEGYVCKYERKDKKETVVIKIQKEKHQQSSLLEEREVMKALTEQSRLNRFPKYIDQQMFNGKRYIVMEYLPQSIEQFIQSREMQGENFQDIVSDIASQMVDCLKQMHSAGYIHRDIKQGNFCSNKDGRVIIVDFGLTLKLQEQQNATFVGTPCYSSINAHKGLQQSQKDDLEALGYTILSIMKKEQPLWQINEENFSSTAIHGEYLKEKLALIKDNGISHDHAIIQEYLVYCRSHQFDKETDYDNLKKLLSNTCPCYIINDVSWEIVSPGMKKFAMKYKTINKILEENQDMRFETVIQGLPEEYRSGALDRYIKQQKEKIENILQGGECQYLNDKIVKPGIDKLTKLMDEMLMDFRNHCNKHFTPLIQNASDTIYNIAREKDQNFQQKFSKMQTQVTRKLFFECAEHSSARNACQNKIPREIEIKSISNEQQTNLLQQPSISMYNTIQSQRQQSVNQQEELKSKQPLSLTQENFARYARERNRDALKQIQELNQNKENLHEKYNSKTACMVSGDRMQIKRKNEPIQMQIKTQYFKFFGMFFGLLLLALIFGILYQYFNNQPILFEGLINMVSKEKDFSQDLLPKLDNNHLYLSDANFDIKLKVALQNLPSKLKEVRKKFGSFNYGPEPEGLKSRDWKALEYTDGIYEGEVQKGTNISYGKGIFIRNDGLYITEGWYSDYALNGKGRKIYYSGNIYENDQWINSNCNGYGTYRAKDGIFYSGEWLDNKYHGKGTLTYTNGDIIESETWEKHKLHGSAIYTFKNGTKEIRQYDMDTLISRNKL